MTATAPPTPDTTFVVLLGASRYPRNEKLSNEQFLRSAKAVRQYFEAQDAFSLPSTNLLWLFDSPDAPSDLDGRIRDFLRSAGHRDEASRPRDVIVHHIGHGFFDDQKSSSLALHGLRPDAPDSNYRFKALQLAIKSEARHAEISDPGRVLFRRRERRVDEPERRCAAGCERSRAGCEG